MGAPLAACFGGLQVIPSRNKLHDLAMRAAWRYPSRLLHLWQRSVICGNVRRLVAESRDLWQHCQICCNVCSSVATLGSIATYPGILPQFPAFVAKSLRLWQYL